MKKFFALFLAAVFCCGMLSSCGSKEPVSKIDKIKKAGKLVAYTNPEFPPYEYIGEGGVITGSEMELVRAIAKKLGVEAEIVSAEFDSIIGTIVTGKADIGAAGFTITEERMRAVDFSIPFIRSVQYLIVPEESGIKTVEDLFRDSLTYFPASGYDIEWITYDLHENEPEWNIRTEHEGAGIDQEIGQNMVQRKAADHGIRKKGKHDEPPIQLRPLF